MSDEVLPQIGDLTDVPVVIPVGDTKERVGTVESVYTDDEGQIIADIRVNLSDLPEGSYVPLGNPRWRLGTALSCEADDEGRMIATIRLGS